MRSNRRIHCLGVRFLLLLLIQRRVTGWLQPLLRYQRSPTLGPTNEQLVRAQGRPSTRHGSTLTDDRIDEVNHDSQLSKDVVRHCQTGSVSQALDCLEATIPQVATVRSTEAWNEWSHLLTVVARAITAHNTTLTSTSVQRREELLLRLRHVYGRCKTAAPTKAAQFPTRSVTNALLHAWSQSYSRRAGEVSVALLHDLWTCSSDAADASRGPSHATYVYTLTALARCQGGTRAAQQAEALLEDMHRRSQAPTASLLRPTTTCVNVVLSAWNKSGSKQALERCRIILTRMEDLCAAGRTELCPDTISYNTVLDCLAQSNDRDAGRQAEQLLHHMQEQDCLHKDQVASCQPNAFSFNSVLNSWARSRDPLAASRAQDILSHMEQRYSDGDASFPPDRLTYNTVLAAWARSKQPHAADRARNLLQRMQEIAHQDTNRSATLPNTISYNIMLNALAQQSRDDTDVWDQAFGVFNTMKSLDQQGYSTCRPDSVTYTTLVSLLAKQPAANAKPAAEKAVLLLTELEDAFEHTKDPAYKPNIRTYTTVIHAIARSRVDPERAERIVEHVEKLYESGDMDVQPDCVCYDSLINAFGWSDYVGKSFKCYAIYQKMLDLYQSRRNVLAKPDIITCNSLLNACTYDVAATDQQRAEIMDIVIHTLEEFESNAPTFGWPNHVTYMNALQAMDQHVVDAQARIELAEATFWQCCQKGLVSVPIVTSLHRVLPWERFSDILQDAVLSNKGESLHFNWKLLPRDWTRYAPRPKERRDSPKQTWRAGSARSKSKPSMARIHNDS